MRSPQHVALGWCGHYHGGAGGWQDRAGRELVGAVLARPGLELSGSCAPPGQGR